MLALTVLSGVANSAALTDMPEPPTAGDPVLVRGLALGVCGTDTEIVSGGYGAAPPGENRLIIGHELLGRVEEAPGGSGFSVGDLVVGIVRRPDPVPCAACANGEWDMCLDGRYTERGIKERHGFGAERFRIEPQFLVKLDRSLDRLGVLLEPTTVVAKAWEQIERIGARATGRPRRVPVTGAGPIGLLVALIGAQKGVELRVLDRHAEGARPELVEALGGTYHIGAIAAIGLAWDIVLECTGAPATIRDVAEHLAPCGIRCLAGISRASNEIGVDLGGLNRAMVLNNDVIFGSVNANHRHYAAAAETLAHADRGWLERLITRHEPMERWAEALHRRPDDIKVVIDIAA